MADCITSLQTETPQQGFELAITLARKAVAYTQPSAEIREQLRNAYVNNADSLTLTSQVMLKNGLSIDCSILFIK